MKFRHRVGTFFLLVGLALLVMFIGSIMSKSVDLIFLLMSCAALLSAYLFRHDKPVNDSGRFRVIRQARERRRPGYKGGTDNVEKESDTESHD
jgi:hypothetical protein